MRNNGMEKHPFTTGRNLDQDQRTPWAGPHMGGPPADGRLSKELGEEEKEERIDTSIDMPMC